MKYLLTIFLFISLYAKAQFFGSTLSHGSDVITPDSMMFIFDTTIRVTGLNKQPVTGDATKRIISGTYPGTTIGFSSFSTSTAAWNPAGAGTSCVQPNDGVTNATVPPGFTAAAQECWFTANLFQTTTPCFKSTGWLTGNTYDIYVYASTSFTGINSQSQYGVAGASLLTTALSPNSGSPTTYGNAIITASLNTNQYIKFDNGGAGLAPDGTGAFTFFMGFFTGNQFGFLSAIHIKRHGT